VLFAVSIAILTAAQPYWIVLVFAAMYGFACGAPLVLNPLLTSGYLGMKHFGALYGVLNIMGTVGGAVGPVGAGHALKAVNQALLAINIQVAGEGLAALVKLGVNPKTALDVINAASGRSNVTENLIPQRVITRAWPRTFRLSLLDKDVGIALKLMQDTDVPHKNVEITKHAFAAARAALGEEADHMEFVKEVERAAGVEIK